MMNILFLLSEGAIGGMHKEKIKRVIGLLTANGPVHFQVFSRLKKEIIGTLFPNSSAYNYTNVYKDITGLKKIDLCLFDDPAFCSKANKFSNNVPVIYLFLNTDYRYQLRDYTGITGVFYFEKKAINALPLRLHRKCVYIDAYIQFPSAHLQLNDTAIKRVVYYPSALDKDLNITRTVCYYFNLAFSTKLTVITSKQIMNLIEHEVNDNITLMDENEEDIVIKADAVIADGLQAVKSMAEKIPVIVLGLYGIGGLVTPKIYSKQIYEGCLGRIGSFYNEYIPLKILQYELDLIFTNSGAIRKDASWIGDKLQEKCNTLVKEFGQTIDHLLKKKQGHTTRIYLEPDISILPAPNKQPGQFLLQRKNGHMLTMIEKDEVKIFNLLKKGTTLEDLQDKLGYDKASLLSYFDELLQAEAIYYV